MPWQLIVILLVPIAAFCGSFAIKPVVLGRAIRTVMLLGVAACCGFGFLASFEFPGVTLWKVMYARFGAAALAGAVIPWLVPPAAKEA